MSADPADHGQDVASRISAFVRGYSLEILPRDRAVVADMPGFVPTGTSVYVAKPPNVTLDEVIDVAILLQEAGYRPVPHVPARELESETHLTRLLKRLQDSKFDQLLLLAGDRQEPAGPYPDTLGIYGTGLLEQFGIRCIGVAGHPEGNPVAEPAELRQALQVKNAYAARTGAEMYIVTQLTFFAEDLVGWAKEITSDGNALPIHVGMAGPTRLKTLIKYARLCGIGNSLRALTRKATMISGLLTESTPDELIATLAHHPEMTLNGLVAGAHFYSFGGVENTARWANAVVNGRFRMKPDNTGFDVEP